MSIAPSHFQPLFDLVADIFIGLNAVRALSIISLLLVFASSIFVLVSDIQAVNRAAASPSSDMADSDYIECVHIFPLADLVLMWRRPQR